ncbi:type I phosphomannose isomerase catalytic subunit [Tenacibaculum finnmarkense]|uniref:Phosphohexomutase n=1 Tax=Tenacibaculum finnmarkense genomovar ulcerans TaxID=2781388 RepID=A0A2I2LD99_9FLAO|nr:type I phosphomannose isomerase catalytic subunit [Tenacibaculum finnmarkense]MBE7634899.1 mannose-6-phosphate isomerase [Tenacibaculum finnmarkense genomovar ulcerans]MBE7645696.1 mannose-6-phosphate isomerase [Tenacibaculum finnmarkense genomovar ulcerans]MBE7647483.1 mannose-6-phosphate isomerase [Tenacibaculum finnmarkense genomovar ulcerans]MBE7687738.1 mannose-6-phosphate isomerase [Tenacibaculum finnmarkense genomovar ulcerans]MBE7697339.1 mannose-6-phosphate isomerase [Tenacibaculum
MIQQLLRFEPILKSKIWGGQKLKTVLHKKANKKDVGESWEISDVEQDISIVSNAALKGRSLKSLIQEFKEQIVGEKVYLIFGDKFPLLIKFIDAKKTLSLQVHPNDVLAQKRHNSLGKTEMWYIVDADKKAKIIIGFSEETDKKSFLKTVENNDELALLNIDYVKKGDTFLVPSGRVHAIGKGVLLAEIQETSDVTYRISDWGRKDSNGKLRDLHLNLALDAIDYSAKSNYKAEYLKRKNNPSTIVDCKYFTTNYLHLTKNLILNNDDKDSFVIYMCVEGTVFFEYKKQQEKLRLGETILVPACIKNVTAITENAKLLEVYIK